MPVFADVLPEPGELIYPTHIYTPYVVSPGVRALLFLWLWICLALYIFWIICLWKIFKKAGLHWRGSLIPIYRVYLRFKMVWRNGRWTATLLNPWMFLIVLIISYFKTAENFGKDKEQFWMWLTFLHPIFLWILAFDKSKYKK